MDEKQRLDDFLKPPKYSVTNVQQNMELLSVHLASFKRHRPLLSMVSMEELRAFASFEETIRCLNEDNKYSELRLTALKDQTPVFAFINGPQLVKSNDTSRKLLQYGEDMSSCVFVDKFSTDSTVYVIVWKNLHTGEIVCIMETIDLFPVIVLSKNGKICFGYKISNDDLNRYTDFVVHLDAFPTYRFEYVDSSQSPSHNMITVEQFMDHDTKMLVCKMGNVVEYFLENTSTLVNKNQRILHQKIQFPDDGFKRVCVGDPHSGLLAWNSVYSIGLYDTATNEMTTFKNYDKHKPAMVIGYMQDVKIAFSKRHVAFVFCIHKTQPVNMAHLRYHLIEPISATDAVIIVCDTVEKTLYETRFPQSVMVECCGFLNDRDYLVISTSDRGMKVWDFKNTKETTDLYLGYIDHAAVNFDLFYLRHIDPSINRVVSFDASYSKPPTCVSFAPVCPFS